MNKKYMLSTLLLSSLLLVACGTDKNDAQPPSKEKGETAVSLSELDNKKELTEAEKEFIKEKAKELENGDKIEKTESYDFFKIIKSPALASYQAVKEDRETALYVSEREASLDVYELFLYHNIGKEKTIDGIESIHASLIYNAAENPLIFSFEPKKVSGIGNNQVLFKPIMQEFEKANELFSDTVKVNVIISYKDKEKEEFKVNLKANNLYIENQKETETKYEA